jgi:hypothetical protein
MFDVVVHADWSTNPGGRWCATARRDGTGWQVAAPEPVGDLERYRDHLIAEAADASVLAGFDFPIGLPHAYGRSTGLPGFREALRRFGTEDGWHEVYAVARTPADISLRRPFYPAGTGAGTKIVELVTGLGLGSADDLLRVCERGGAGRKRASPLFWTVGAAQVGRAAIAGWRHVVAPALRAGAALWPFDGPLEELAGRGRLVIAETYPADSYAAVGAPFRPGESKRRQGDRRGKADAILGWAATRGLGVAACENVLRDGFGAARAGEDAFDALLGLLAMIPVVEAPARAISARLPPAQLAWEGWILGR